MHQDDIFESTSQKPEFLIDNNQARLLYYPQFVSNHDFYFNYLKEQLAWQQDTITIYGKQHKTPRLTAWYGDNQLQYRYSGLTLIAKPWDKQLLLLKQRIEDQLHICFNTVLANYYRDGQDSMGWHADDEPELGKQPVIASLSLGGERRFSLRHRHDKSLKPVHIPLAAGSLLVMSGNTQANYMHQVAKTKKAVEPRINLTFRTIINDR